jgi:hypothetical protein
LKLKIGKTGARRSGFVLLALSLFAYGLSHCTYWVFGDASDYIMHSNSIRNGFVEHNLAERALAKADPTHKPAYAHFNTEAGFHFLLHLARKIDVNWPYMVNGLAAPLLLLGLICILMKTEHAQAPPLLAPALFVVALMLTSGERLQAQAQFHFMNLCLPFRETPSHGLAVASLLVAICAERTSTRRKRYLALFAGALLGLACWFRITAILLAPVMGLIFLVPELKGRNVKSIGVLILLLGIGGVIGLMPLATQDWLEGKTIFESGQADLMLETRPGEEPEQTFKSLSPRNFKRTLLGTADIKRGGTLHIVSTMLPGWMWISLLVSVVLGMRTNPRRIWILGGAAFIEFIFYSCYIRPVPRYLFPTILFLLPLCFLWVPLLIQTLMKTRSETLRHRVALLASVVAVLAAVASTVRQQGAFKTLGSEYREMHDFRDWLAEHIVPHNGVMYANNPALKAVCENYLPVGIKVNWRWRGHLREATEKYFATTDGPGEARAYMILPAMPDGTPLVSWCYEDALNEYQMTPVGPPVRINDAPFEGQSIIAMRLDAQTQTDVTFKVEPLAGDAPYYLRLRARELPGTNRAQRVSLSAPDTNWTQSTHLQAGPNMIRLDGFPKTARSLQLHSADPLPTFQASRVDQRNTLFVPFTRYLELPNAGNTVGNLGFLPLGYADWGRDWAHIIDPIKPKRFWTYPNFLLRDGSRVRLFTDSEPYYVRLFYTSRCDKDALPANEQFRADLQQGSYEQKGSPLLFARYFIGEMYESGNYAYRDLIDEVVVQKVAPGNLGDLLFRLPREANPYQRVLMQVEFSHSPLPDALALEPGQTVQLIGDRNKHEWANGFRTACRPTPENYPDREILARPASTPASETTPTQ